jgi:hypothetical protein
MGYEAAAVTVERQAIPEEPPPWVRSEVLWRLAVRLYRDHSEAGEACTGCGQRWPCSGRRLAELGLGRAATGWSEPQRRGEQARAG